MANFNRHEDNARANKESAPPASPPPGGAATAFEAARHAAYAAGTVIKPEPTLYSEDSALRKTMPIAEGVFGYFPDAVAYVAYVSYLGNQKHNPGEPLHWARAKSADHLDCVARHLASAGTKDKDGVRHSGNLAWRAMANLQLELETALKLPPPRNAK